MKDLSLLFFILSLFFHLSFLFISSRLTPTYKIMERRGELFEISKPGASAEALTRTQGTEPAPTIGGGFSTPKTPAGISDGSEFGISKPQYPESSRLRGEEGKVLLKLFLDSKQALIKVELVTSSGFPDLDRSALSQVERDLAKSHETVVKREHLVQFNFYLSTVK